MKHLYLVIADFNGYVQTRRCLQAIYASVGVSFTVVLVDHGTSNETELRVAAEFPDVVRIKGSPDLWWAGATNLGIRTALECGAEAVMLLNNDSYVTPLTLAAMVTYAECYPSAIIAPVQRDWQSGQLISISARSCLLLGFLTLSGPHQLCSSMPELLPVELVIGGRGVVISKQIFDKIGLFDEQTLPHYGADHDFYMRAKKAGITLYTATRVSVDIDNSRTTIAEQPGRLNFSAFLQTLRSIRSHRNLKDVTSLFRKHYPVPHCYHIGVVLYIGRYCLVYACKRAFFLAGNALKRAA